MTATDQAAASPAPSAQATASAAAPLLELTGIRASYGEFQALFDISLEVRAGEIVTLIGANGAGKTTTLRVISGSVCSPAARCGSTATTPPGCPPT